MKDDHTWESTEKKGKTPKPLFPIFCFVFSCIFCFGVYVWVYKSNFGGALMDLLKWYLVPVASLESQVRAGSQSGSDFMSMAGKLSG